jgi:hypothetical protein
MNLLRLSLCLLMLFRFGAGESLHASVAGFDPPAFTKSSKDTFPVPEGISNLLFYLQRDPDANTVVYQLNLTEQGLLNEAEPVKIFWIRYAEKGQRKELNYIHRKFAYGLLFKKLSPDKYEFRFVSHDKIQFGLMKGKDGNYQVSCSIFNKPAILKRMYVRIDGGSFWVPNVLYVDFIGVEEATGKEITQRYKP